MRPRRHRDPSSQPCEATCPTDRACRARPRAAAPSEPPIGRPAGTARGNRGRPDIPRRAASSHEARHERDGSLRHPRRTRGARRAARRRARPRYRGGAEHRGARGRRGDHSRPADGPGGRGARPARIGGGERDHRDAAPGPGGFLPVRHVRRPGHGRVPRDRGAGPLRSARPPRRGDARRRGPALGLWRGDGGLADDDRVRHRARHMDRGADPRFTSGTSRRPGRRSTRSSCSTREPAR